MDYLNKAINYSSGLINRDIYLYLYILIKFIFLKPRKSKKLEQHMEKYTNRINEQIIKDKDKYIKIEVNLMYTKQNLMNILDFIKMQNLLYAGDIFEGILIVTFSYGFETDKDNCFGKYLFNNLYRFYSLKHNDIANWYIKEKFRDNEDIESLITMDITHDNKKDSLKEKRAPVIETSSFMEEEPLTGENDSIFYNLLLEINKNKYQPFYLDENNTKAKWYIHRGVFNSQTKLSKLYKFIIKNLENKKSVTLDRDIASNSIPKIISDIFDEHSLGHASLKIVLSFFISVYIYYQNKHSQFIKYSEPSEYIEGNEDEDDKYISKDPIPFELDLKGAYIEGRYSNIIFSPIRIEPRILRLNISQNNFRENGFTDMSKVLLFNNNLSYIDYNVSLLKSYYLDYLNYTLGIFDNYSVKEINFSYNYIREDCNDYLARLLSHLKGLKTLNLSSNDLKKGLSSFFIMLKRLYRESKINLENLYLNKCTLDDASFYELGELLKSKYCKLKRLYLSQNNKVSNINFLKKLKKNRSLIELNFSKSNIGAHDLADIKKIISNTSIKHLYLYKNKITDFNELIRTLFRTRLIKEEFENEDNVMNNDDALLLNLDLSNSDIWLKNKNQVILVNKIIKETNLSCLDISHILYGPSPDKKQMTASNESYRNFIDNNIKPSLEKTQSKYIELIENKVPIEIEIKDLEKENYDELNDFDEELNIKIEQITNDKEAKNIVFLKKNALEIIQKINTEAKYDSISRKANLANKKDKKKFFNKIVSNMRLIYLKKRLGEIDNKIEKKKLIII